MQDYGSNYTVAEINPVTMDSVFAEDTDIYDDPDATTDATANGTLEREHIGRFIPLRVLLNRTTPALTTPPDAADYAATGYPKPNFTNYLAGSNKGIAVNDFGYDPSYVPGSTGKANWEPFWRYHWADDLFDYLSVRTPSDDYLPNIPMQKEWHPVDPNIATPTLQYQYRTGDLVSYYNPNSVISPGVTVPAHEIWRCTGNVQPSASKLPAQAGFTRIFQCRAVKNSLDQIKFSDATFTDARAGSAAFRTDPNEVISPQQTYADAHREDNATVEGLININTADWKVLSTLPLIVNPQTGLPDDTLVSSVALPGFPAGTYPGYTFRQLNQEMAKAIEYYRDVNADPAVVRTPGAPLRPHGPFRSIEELNQVVDLRPGRPPALNPSPTSFGYPINTLPGFRNGLFTVPLPSMRTDEAGDTLGDFTPADITGVVNANTDNKDGVRGDYEERNLQLTRISNMITTRSDSFTCYILVQGWRNAETPQAQLVVQRRVGYLMDRSRVTPLTPDAMSIEPFPNN
jgi:hypothetical protein